MGTKQLFRISGLFAFFILKSGTCNFAFSQNISVNTSGAANSTSSMFEVLQPSATSNTIGIFARHSGAATNAYAIWAEATAGTNKYAIVVPSTGGYVGLGTIVPVTVLNVSGVTNPLVMMDGYGVPGKIIGRRANGTLAAPTAVILNDELATYSARGYDGTGFTTTTGGMGNWASENWNATSHGTYLTLHTTSNGTLGNAERMRIDHNGYVGIGTISPLAKLHLYGGSILVENSNTFQGSAVTDDGSIELYRSPSGSVPTVNGYIDFKGVATDDHMFRINWDYSLNTNTGGLALQSGTGPFPSTSVMRMVILNSNGFVGIGNTLPFSRLDVKGSGNTNATYGFGVRNSADSYAMVVRDDGYVGIGTPTPAAHVDVYDAIPGVASLNVSKYFNGIGNINAAFIGGTDFGYTNTGIYVAQKDALGFPSATSYIFNVVNNGLSNFVVNGLGMVGIGTLSPAEKLTVHIGADLNMGITSIGGMATLLAHNDAWNAWTDLSLGNNFLVVKGNGNVGIGTINPGYTLDVAGSFNAITFYCNTALWCSDVRYKKDITVLENSLDNVLKLQGVNYFWKTKDFPDKKFTDAKQIGFIAQEVEKIYPELVNTNENGYKSVDYSKFTPILLEAIKEQQNIINGLKLSVGQLSEENKTLKANSEARISKLEAAVQTLMLSTQEEAKK